MLMSLDCAGGSRAARQRRAHAAHCGIRRERVRALPTSGIHCSGTRAQVLQRYISFALTCEAHFCTHYYERAHICFHCTCQ